eukprot:CAMPEP_0113309670 /NCGR_PEP_ID=MMETSP0010_2-20120614/7620_1 /TAXON_ID=216773 ORGANISM="Corethron hystrix, Strain 308" /NCGR_SAMPLE_ID=MMETSP0010_2 /ASSEMBLY_ACC=CAM_ASM_000155 /LENGTH=430 /DNA_ID=CAMNT_0000164967 /DNA_START=199 /DNA_END=1491 /DNA_ORIENTATION=- /assembly_acc=CAM_ASM_000155
MTKNSKNNDTDNDIDNDNDNDNGVQSSRIYVPSSPAFPSSSRAVVSSCVSAIRCALNSSGKEDGITRGGRLGIELDGCRYLLDAEALSRFRRRYSSATVASITTGADDRSRSQNGRHPVTPQKKEIHVEVDVTSESSMRPVFSSKYVRYGKHALELEGLRVCCLGIARGLVESYPNCPSVEIYFDGLNLARLAVGELDRMQKSRQWWTSKGEWERIVVKYLGQKQKMNNEDSPKNDGVGRRRRKRMKHGVVDPSNGIVLVVQPTDVGKTDLSFIENLQGLAMQTSVLQQPFVIISPRFLNMGSSGGLDHGIELSSTFGGSEPARGSPWFLRDFRPPIYAWVADAVSRQSSLDGRHMARLSLSSSIVDRGNPWHMFVALSPCRDPWDDVLAERKEGRVWRENDDVKYEHFGSSSGQMGRPSGEAISASLSR